MARQNPRNHIKLIGYNITLDYEYPKKNGFGGLVPAQRNRNQHGNHILNQLNAIRQQFDMPADTNLPKGILRDDAIYIDFISEWGYQLDYKALDQDKEDALFQILNIREEEQRTEEGRSFRYQVTLMMTVGGIGSFIKKIGDYIEKNGKYRTGAKKGQDTGNPQYYLLFTNIESIQAATLKSFWTDEPEYPFPVDDKVVWWEAWFRKTNNDEFKIRRV